MSSSTPQESRPAKRRSHLLDPNAPRPVYDPDAERKLIHVQQWVMSTLAVITFLHLAAGFILGAWALDDPGPGAVIGLNVLAGIVGVISIAAARAIHHRRILSWWLLLGALITPLGLWLTGS
ncbi:hypothetical protein EUA06_11615 [Nocardioides glacieisoli]|jgi:hypothetical protein|uniref:Uncharacterized protein n=1 Tax=Nocardioides glacieisoli TaxID=1168730 RepID=A0A4Q2RU17_9ACTN|nr:MULTISPECIES: hypothetical protein [Nocardioides]QSR29061.1 hypothetical protein CFI00_00785 [Nocardioides sp. S5]RYB90903.1 hypothetical protein EUA06_11615 [Nocardioides glacieisoli]GIM62661.1 hypothetical protein Pve01_77900 [Planomonospora venezuelensis]